MPQTQRQEFVSQCNLSFRICTLLLIASSYVDPHAENMSGGNWRGAGADIYTCLVWILV